MTSRRTELDRRRRAARGAARFGLAAACALVLAGCGALETNELLQAAARMGPVAGHVVAFHPCVGSVCKSGKPQPASAVAVALVALVIPPATAVVPRPHEATGIPLVVSPLEPRAPPDAAS